MSARSVSVDDYPEHLNPFYESDNHNKIRFWEKGKRIIRSNSLNISDFKSLSRRLSFRKKEKTEDTPVRPPRTPKATYRSSISPSGSTPSVSGYRGARHTVTGTLSPAYKSNGVSHSNTSISSTNPFDDEEDIRLDLPPRPSSSLGVCETECSTPRSTLTRKKKRAPPPPASPEKQDQDNVTVHVNVEDTVSSENKQTEIQDIIQQIAALNNIDDNELVEGEAKIKEDENKPEVETKVDIPKIEVTYSSTENLAENEENVENEKLVNSEAINTVVVPVEAVNFTVVETAVLTEPKEPKDPNQDPEPNPPKYVKCSFDFTDSKSYTNQKSDVPNNTKEPEPKSKVPNLKPTDPSLILESKNCTKQEPEVPNNIKEPESICKEPNLEPKEPRPNLEPNSPKYVKCGFDIIEPKNCTKQEPEILNIKEHDPKYKEPNLEHNEPKTDLKFKPEMQLKESTAEPNVQTEPRKLELIKKSCVNLESTEDVKVDKKPTKTIEPNVFLEISSSPSYERALSIEPEKQSNIEVNDLDEPKINSEEPMENQGSISQINLKPNLEPKETIELVTHKTKNGEISSKEFNAEVIHCKESKNLIESKEIVENQNSNLEKNQPIICICPEPTTDKESREPNVLPPAKFNKKDAAFKEINRKPNLVLINDPPILRVCPEQTLKQETEAPKILSFEEPNENDKESTENNMELNSVLINNTPILCVCPEPTLNQNNGAPKISLSEEPNENDIKLKEIIMQPNSISVEKPPILCKCPEPTLNEESTKSYISPTNPLSDSPLQDSLSLSFNNDIAFNLQENGNISYSNQYYLNVAEAPIIEEDENENSINENSMNEELNDAEIIPNGTLRKFSSRNNLSVEDESSDLLTMVQKLQEEVQKMTFDDYNDNTIIATFETTYEISVEESDKNREFDDKKELNFR